MENIYSQTVLSNDEGQEFGTLLLNERIIYLVGEIKENVCSMVSAQLLYLNSIDTKKPIHLYISGPGGSVEACKIILNTMDHIEAPVYTYALGMVASADAVIFSHGDKRFITPTSCVMYHQCLFGIQGEIQNINVNTNFVKRSNNIMISTLMHDLGYINDKEFSNLIHGLSLMDDKGEYPKLMVSDSLMKKLAKFKTLIDRDTYLIGKAIIDFGGADEFIVQKFKTTRTPKSL